MKHKRGQGHIVKRGNKWGLVIELPRDPVTRKRRQQWFPTEARSEKEAGSKLRAELLKLETGSYVKPVSTTLGEYLKSWLEEYVEIKTRPSTADGYKDIVNAHLIPELGTLRLTALEPSHIQAYYTRMMQSGRRDGKGGLSAMTIKNHHRVLSKALKVAVKRGIVGRNIAEAVDLPKCNQKDMGTLAPDDVKRLLEAAQETPFYTLFYTALYTGLRRSELLGLRWKDVDLDMATLSVVKTMQQIAEKGYVIGDPKTKYSKRAVDLPPSLAILLREHKLSTLYTLGYSPTPDDLVFRTAEGKPLPPNGVTKAFHDLARSLGLRDIHFHSLRHSHATLMLRDGVHPKIVSERLGHASIGITLDTYSHVLPGLQKAAARRFDEGLGNMEKTMVSKQLVSSLVNS